MSYDGGLVVKINNKKLGEVLDELNEKGYFPNGSVPRWRDKPEENDWGEVIKPSVKYTLFYSYMDCAYVEGCPKDIHEVGKFIAQLIWVYEEEASNYDYNKLQEIRNRIEQDDVVKDYKLVSWEYYQPDSGDLEEFHYKGGGNTDKKKGNAKSLLPDGELVFKDRAKVPGQNWSIGVPEGFAYSTDPKVNGNSSSNPSGVYELILAKPKSRQNTDFVFPYNNGISFVTLEYSSFKAFELDLQIKKDDYEKIILTDDLSVILIPMLSVHGTNSYYIYVNSEMQIRRCQLLVNGSYKKEEKLEFARQLAGSIRLVGEENNILYENVEKGNATIESSSKKASKEGEKASASQKRSKKREDANGETVTVDNTWQVTIPAGFKYSTDKEIIGSNRNIIFIEDKAGNDFESPYSASISFTSAFTKSPVNPAPVTAKITAGILGNDLNVIKDEADLYVVTYLMLWGEDADDADVFHITIGCGAGVSSIQVRFNTKLSRSEETKLVESVARSIRLVGDGASYAARDLSEEDRAIPVVVKEKANKQSSYQPSGSMEGWNFQVAQDSKIDEELIDNETGYAIIFLPRSMAKKNGEHDLAMFQYKLFTYSENRTTYNNIIEHANKFLSLFEESGIAEDVRNGKLKNSAPIHALRSFIWTVTETQKGAKETFPVDAPESMWIEAARFIAQHGNVNYKPVRADAYRLGAELLRKEEVCSIYDPLDWIVDKEFDSPYIDDALEKTMKKASKINFGGVVYAVEQTIPVMDYYYQYLQNNTTEEKETLDTIRLILHGWLLYAFACRQPFSIVPGKYKEKYQFSEIPDGLQLPEIKEIESGRFTVFGSELIKFNDNSPTLVIPEGVTGILWNISKDLEASFASTRKIIYPRSYVGPIVIPEKVKSIEVLGNHEVLRMTALKGHWTQTELEEIKFIGVPQVIAPYAFSKASKAKKIVIPEGTERVSDFAFSELDNIKIMLPESITELGGNVFTHKGGIGTNVEIHVYEQCPVLGKIKSQIEKYKKHLVDHNKRHPDDRLIDNIRLIEMESPWTSRAEAFTKKIDELYKEKEPNVSEDTVKAMLEEVIGTEEALKKCKDALVSKALGRKQNNLAGIIKNADDTHELYESLPKELTIDINNHIEERIKVERKQLQEELSTLLAEKKQKYEEEKLSKQRHITFDSFLVTKEKEWNKNRSEIIERIADSNTIIWSLQKQIKEKKNELDNLSVLKFGRKKELIRLIAMLSEEEQRETVNKENLTNKRIDLDKVYDSETNGIKSELSKTDASLSNLKRQIDSLEKQLEALGMS